MHSFNRKSPPITQPHTQCAKPGLPPNKQNRQKSESFLPSVFRMCGHTCIACWLSAFACWRVLIYRFQAQGFPRKFLFFHFSLATEALILQAFEVTTKSRRNFLFHWSLYKWRFFVLISERIFSPFIPFGKECPLCFVIPFSFTTQILVWQPAETSTNRKIHQRNNFHPPIAPSECPYLCRELFLGGAHFFIKGCDEFSIWTLM